MPGYTTLSRLSLIQLNSEERKQRAHLKKISEMQRHSGLDNGVPSRFPHLRQNFLKQFNAKRQEIKKENEIKSEKLFNIMTSKVIRPPPPFHPTNQIRRTQTKNLFESNSDYFGRISRAKGKYDVHKWRKEYEQHKEHLRIGRDNKLFTPLDIGVNRQRITKTVSLMNSKRTTPTPSLINMFHKHDKKDQI